jgi:site-specific DNA-cytosine methylase
MITEPSHPKGQTTPTPCGACRIGGGRPIPSVSAKRILSSGRHRPFDPRHPAPTLQKRDGGLQNDGAYWRDGANLVEISSDERKLIASFPLGHAFVGSTKDVAARIGNSVPPLLMRAIARHIRGLLPKRPGEP